MKSVFFVGFVSDGSNLTGIFSLEERIQLHCFVKGLNRARNSVSKVGSCQEKTSNGFIRLVELALGEINQVCFIHGLEINEVNRFEPRDTNLESSFCEEENKGRNDCPDKRKLTYDLIYGEIH